MLLRRISKHVKDQNWFAVFIDTMIVVLGVFLGIQMANLNQSRVDSEIAKSYMKRIRADLSVEKKHYQHVIDYFKSTREHTLAALKAYKNPSDELGLDFIVDLYQASQSWNVSVRSGTYQELLATGRIGLIEDDEIRNFINNYYEGATTRKITLDRNSSVPYRKLLRMHLDETIQIKIREECDDVFIIDEKNNYFYIKLPEACKITLPEALVQDEVQKLLKNKELQQELRFQLTSLDAMLNSINTGIKTAEFTLQKTSGNE